MATLDWIYHRNGCTTCGKAQEFLGRKKIKPVTLVDARKNRMGKKDALKLAQEAHHIYASKGRKVVHLDLKKERTDDATLLSYMMGPTGNLRAPTLRFGKTLMIGFDEETYAKLMN